MGFEEWVAQISQSELFIAVVGYLIANISVILGLVIFAIKNKLRKDAAEIALEEYKASLLKSTMEHEEVFVNNMDKRLSVMESKVIGKIEEQVRAKKEFAEAQAKQVMQDLEQVKKEDVVKKISAELSEVLKVGK